MGGGRREEVQGGQQGTCKGPDAGGRHWEKDPGVGPPRPGVEGGSHSTRGGGRADQETSRELERLRKRFKQGRGLCLFLIDENEPCSILCRMGKTVP